MAKATIILVSVVAVLAFQAYQVQAADSLVDALLKLIKQLTGIDLEGLTGGVDDVLKSLLDLVSDVLNGVLSIVEALPKILKTLGITASDLTGDVLDSVAKLLNVTVADLEKVLTSIV